jgi:hypothetical protein
MIKKIVVFLINTYQLFFSPDTGIFKKRFPTCRFVPSCSEYTRQAVIKYGACKGIAFGIKRILKCHPWHSGGIDPLT